MPDFELGHAPPTTPTAPPLRPASCTSLLRRSPASGDLPSLLEIHSTASPTRPAIIPADDVGAARGSRSPPPTASPVRANAPVQAPHNAMDDIDDHIPGDSEDGEPEEEGGDEDDEEEEVYSDGSPVYPPANGEPDDLDADLLWMPEGDMLFTFRIAFAFLNADAPQGNPAPFIRDAIYSVAPAQHYRMFPSSRGAMMLLFDSREQRDAVVNDQPIVHDGGRLTFERSEETSNRFVAIPEWLVAVSSLDFPPEHWNRANVPAVFRKLGTVVEIDPACLDGDYSSMRVAIERLRPTRIPDDLWISNPGGLGTTFRVSELRGPWRREKQLDAHGNLRPFFPRPPPGPGGNELHDYMPGHMAPPPAYGPPPPGSVGGPGPPAPFGGMGRPFRGRFSGFDTFYYGYINPYPLPHLPTLPIVIPAPPSTRAAAVTPPPALPTTLRLTWYPPTSPDSTPPPPPPSPATTPPLSPALTNPPPLAPAPRRRHKQPSATKIKRQSTRLAEKEEAEFVDATTKAMQRKAIRESLAACSKDLKHHVKTRKLLKKKNPLGALDLGRLAKAAGIGCAGRRAVAVAAATGRSP
ncbi:unnamed protein product [Urochloa humidicola]